MPRDKALCMSQYAGKEGKGLMKQTVLKTTVAVLGAGLVSYLGTLAVPMLVLLGVMLLDYITGMIKAYIRAELNSKFGIKGILKKLCYMVMVAVGAAVDYLLRGAVIGAGITLDVKLFFADRYHKITPSSHHLHPIHPPRCDGAALKCAANAETPARRWPQDFP